MSTTRQYNIISSSSVVANRNDDVFFLCFFWFRVCVRWFVLSLALRVQKSSSPSLQHGIVVVVVFWKCRFISLNDAKKSNIHHKFLIYETSKTKPERWVCAWERALFFIRFQRCFAETSSIGSLLAKELLF